ncbi:MAG: diaminopimelate epimerase [Planctomycetes bacterium]|nr:diaminopimelate epimerase [Planctomycetota bacterium]
MSARLRVLSGTGNRFALVDACSGPTPADLPTLARALCAPVAGGPRLDGLLLVSARRAGAGVFMQLVNADGSLAETCGNGLRCTAKFAWEGGLVQGTEFVVEDGAGRHEARVALAGGRVVSAVVSMPRPRILARAETLSLDGRAVVGTRLDVGNPHFVIVVDDVAAAPVRTDGPLVERHPAFERGTNVEFVALRGGRLEMRVWERGVGETAACGSGACAAAAALADLGLATLPVEIALPGGLLVVAQRDDGAFDLSGGVEDLGEVLVPRLPGAAQSR